jgi:hypothetical protein
MPELRYHQIRPNFHPPSIHPPSIHPSSIINQSGWYKTFSGLLPFAGLFDCKKKTSAKHPLTQKPTSARHLTHPRPGPGRLLPLRRALRLQTKTVSKTSPNPKANHHNNPIHPAKTTLNKTNTNLRPLPTLERALALQQRRPGINHRIDSFAHNLAHRLARALNRSFTRRRRRRRRRRPSFLRTNLLSSALGNFLRRLFGLGRSFLRGFLRVRSRFLHYPRSESDVFLCWLLGFGSGFLHSAGGFLRGRFGFCGHFFGRGGSFLLRRGLLGYAGGFGAWAGASGFLCFLFLGRGSGGLGRGGFGFLLGWVSMSGHVRVDV